MLENGEELRIAWALLSSVEHAPFGGTGGFADRVVRFEAVSSAKRMPIIVCSRAVIDPWSCRRRRVVWLLNPLHTPELTGSPSLFIHPKNTFGGVRLTAFRFLAREIWIS